MRPFDWVALFTRQRVHYVERGPNVKRGEINIKCPWCGAADPSQHLGISLETGWYACWRNKQGHSGKSPLRLLMRLLRVSYGEARELAGLSDDCVDPEGFTAVAARVLGRDSFNKPSTTVKTNLELDRQFISLENERVLTRRWWNYLYTRGFDSEDITPLCKRYSLMAARYGDFAMRLIIPYFVDKKLVAWTGRAIAPSVIRYKDLSIENSVVPVKKTLYNHDVILAGGRALVLVEGPLDALKLDYYGEPFGVRAVALSTNSLSDSQVYAIEDASQKFDSIIVMMDNKSQFGLVDSMRMKQNLFFASNLQIMSVPSGKGDAGDLTSNEVREWSKKITRNLQ